VQEIGAVLFGQFLWYAQQLTSESGTARFVEAIRRQRGRQLKQWTDTVTSQSVLI